MFDTCPVCNSIKRELTKSDEITVESVEIREEN